MNWRAFTKMLYPPRRPGASLRVEGIIFPDRATCELAKAANVRALGAGPEPDPCHPLPPDRRSASAFSEGPSRRSSVATPDGRVRRKQPGNRTKFRRLSDGAHD